MVGVLSVGYLATSIAKFVAEGNNTGKSLEFAGILLPAITAKSLPVLASFIIMIFLSKAILAIFFTRTMAERVATIEARAARQISKNALGGNLELMRRFKKEELTYSLQIGTSSAFTSILNAFATLAAEGFLFITLSIAFLTFNPLATLAMLAYFSVLAILINFFIGKRLSIASQDAYGKTLDASRLLNDLINSFRELSVSGGKGRFFQGIYESRISASRSLGKQTYLSGMPRHVIETGLIIGIGLFIFIQSNSSNLVEAAATIGIFLAGGFRIIAAMLPLQNSLVIIRTNIPLCEKTWNILELSSIHTGITSQIDLNQKPPVSVASKNVSYSFPEGPEVIKGLTFTVEAGKNVAIIGASGAGKSTIADLVLGLLQPSSGDMQIDGENSKNLIELKPGIASYVPQLPGIISGSLLANITLRQKAQEVDETNLKYAIKASFLESLISMLPQGLDTHLDGDNAEISGGQRQKIGLARALYTRPSLLVLDEATAALDAASEFEIVSAINSLRGKVTVITIAHRLNSVKNADSILYLENGHLAASGTLIELQQTNKQVARAIELLSLD